MDEVLALEHALLEEIDESVVIYDRDGRFRYLNRASARVIGQSKDELVGKVLWELFPDAVGNAFHAAFQRVLATGKAESFEHHYPAWDRWFENQLFTFRGGLCCLAKDITKVKRAVAHAEAERARFHSLLMQAPAPIAIVSGKELRYELSNPMNVALSEGRALPGKTVREALPELEAQGMVAMAERVFETGEGFVANEVPLTVRHEGGVRTIYLNGTYQPIRDASGAVEAIFAIAFDVTETVTAKKVAQASAERAQRMHRVTAALGGALSTEQVCDVIVRETAEAHGASAGAVILLDEGGAVFRLVGTVGYPPELREQWAQFDAAVDLPVTTAVRTNAPVFLESRADRDAKYPMLAGHDITFEDGSWAVVPLAGKTGSIGALALSFDTARVFDATERAFLVAVGQQCAQALDRSRLYAAEQTARALAEEANRAKDEFLATISHELRTPLNAMLGWARMLRTGDVREDRRARGLEAIERNAVAQAQLIEELLDISRIVSGTLRLEVGTVDLFEIIEAALQAVGPAAEAKQIRLESKLDAAAGMLVGDANRLQQVIYNLLSNAIKFTPKAGRVDVTLARVSSKIEISVIDDGAGIAPAFLPIMFQRFQQADASITRAHGGLGLGLAISRHIVELHGGTIAASSEGLGKGATFTVHLPEPMAVTRRESMPSPSGRIQTLLADAPAELVGLRVLAIDDEADARELVATVLGACGAHVTTVASAAEAFAAIDRALPDVVISDIAMPDVDGYEFIRKLRARTSASGRDLPAAALTAYARAEDRRRALVSGFQMHMPKPIEPAELVAVVGALARLRLR